MKSIIRSALALTALTASIAGAQQQAGSAAPATPPGPPAGFPAAGQAAPDFSATATDSTGKSIPVSLAGLRGKVVVLAFYPLDRSRGCTIELSKFRDDYKTLFPDGVVVLPTSIDTLASHASWAKDAHFPFAMIADPKGDVAGKYVSQPTAGKPFARTIFVIGKDGKVAYSNHRFNVNAQDGWDTLAAEIKKAKGN